jgi:cell fate (sporulation/competence/biofilm development) regulator YlbF (YheA/YmcA/DUF963 family)
MLYYSAPGDFKRGPANKLNMQTQTNGNAVLDKTRELCQTILADPNMGVIRTRIDTFMADATARNQYETLMTKGQALQEKQERSLPLSPEEVSDFETNRESLLKNPVARGFLDAREELHELQHSIQKLVSKTLELGRMPTKDDLEEGCGHGGCGCHDHEH